MGEDIFPSLTPSHLIAVPAVPSHTLRAASPSPQVKPWACWWGWGQVPHLLQEERVKGRRASFPRPCYHMAYERGMTYFPILTPSGLGLEMWRLYKETETVRRRD